MHWRDLIEQRPGVMVGKPVFKGTRLTVEHILRELGNGMPKDEVLRGYPMITEEHLRAAQAYAADVMAGHDIIIESAVTER